MEVLLLSGARAPKRALVVADGDVPSLGTLDSAWPGWDRGVDLVVAADGGWDKAEALGLRPDLLVGDADSLPEARFLALAADGVTIERSPTTKDESDAELAVIAALRRGATHITVLGALGGKRFDHALANVGLLGLPAPGDAEVELLTAVRGFACFAPRPRTGRSRAAAWPDRRTTSSRCCPLAHWPWA